MRQKHPLDPLIDGKRTAIAKAERNLDKLKIELATLEKAREATTEKPPGGIRPYKARFAKANGDDTRKRRGRSLSDPWKKVLARIGEAGELGAHLDNISKYCETEGIALKRPTLRAQLSNYVSKHGYLDRAQTGVFALTPKGAEVAGYITERFPAKAGKEAETPR